MLCCCGAIIDDALIEEGQFYCRSCNSQQLAAREEAVVEETLNISRRNVVGSSTTDESSRDASFASDPETEQLSIYDCYNILLYKQVSALIHLGVSEKLKNVVLFIWAKYLQKCEAVFLEEKANEQEKANGIQTNNRNVNKKSRTKETNKNQRTNDLNNDGDASENDQMEIDEPSGAAFISESKNFWSTFEPGLNKIKQVNKMSIHKTLCFCYLGLLYTKDRLLLTDLLRLVYEERIPYLNVADYVPRSKLRQFHPSYFNEKRVPDISKISYMCSQLISFLQLPKVNDRSLVPIALQFVKDLNLPDNFIHIIQMLVEKIDNRNSIPYEQNHVPLYDVKAIGLIIIVFKMFYVLDGEYELNHSEVSRKINIILQDRRLFVWDQWQKQASLKEYLFLKPNSKCCKISLFDSLSASQIVSKYRGCPKDESYIKKDFVRIARQNIAKVFNSLRSGNEAIPETPAPTSFPLTQNLSDFINNWRNLHMYKETEEIDFSLLTEKFSSDILFYKPSSNEDESSREIIELLSDSLYKSIPCVDGSISNFFQTSSNYWRKVPKRYDNDLTWLNDFAPSFQWLIKFMSKYINTPCDVLYLEILRMERIIFFDLQFSY